MVRFGKIKSGRARKKGKKNRKHGRHKDKCRLYRLRHGHEKAHIRRLLRHLRRYPEDGVALEALEKFQGLLKI